MSPGRASRRSGRCAEQAAWAARNSDSAAGQAWNSRVLSDTYLSLPDRSGPIFFSDRARFGFACEDDPSDAASPLLGRARFSDHARETAPAFAVRAGPSGLARIKWGGRINGTWL
jgi:hypothetical protein